MGIYLDVTIFCTKIVTLGNMKLMVLKDTGEIMTRTKK
tara:strand:+ start:41 stop:154 length:114 start_codon:yes stop_codon:yes gene_type:complete